MLWSAHCESVEVRMAKKKTRKIRSKRKSSLRKRKNRKYVAKPTDTRLRKLVIPTPGGVREVGIRGFEQASRLGKYWAAVQVYLQTGDDSALLRFQGRSFT